MNVFLTFAFHQQEYLEFFLLFPSLFYFYYFLRKMDNQICDKTFILKPP